MPSTIPISADWSFAEVGGGQVNAKDEWIPCSQFPTSVHAELIKLGKIPDPYVGLHEWDVQCKLILWQALSTSPLTVPA